MKELRHTEELNGRRADSLRESQKRNMFIDHYGRENPQVRVGNIAKDGKPDWREFVLFCSSCGRVIKRMGTYTNPPLVFCCCAKMKINEPVKPTKSKYLEMKRLHFQGWIDDS